VRNKKISNMASKAGTTAIALCLIAGNAAAARRCASPEELTALKASALRQQLMVAALTCHEAGSFNRFVTTYHEKFVASDHALMHFFVRQSGGRADDAYNAYKTRMANDSSMRSLNDPRFCGRARETFSAALNRDVPLADLVSDNNRPIETGFAGCMADDAMPEAGPAANTPNLPSRHRYTLDGTAVNANANSADAPLAPQREASLEPKSPPQAAIATPSEDAGPAVAAPDGDERDADNGPYTSNGPYEGAYSYQPPAYSGWWYGAQQPMQQVQGPDGRWYLVPAR
jgi:hypothetical protein